MISKETVRQIVVDRLAADECFEVELTISAQNDITLVIDSLRGVSIDYCVELSHLIEEKLSRDEEDYSLEVSSAGIGCALRVLGQFQKNIGNEVEVTYPNGAHKKGILTQADAEGFAFTCREKVQQEGQKKKVEVEQTYRHAYNEVKQVKDIISFK